MHETDNLFLPLINTFNAIGWVPTIRGSLSLNVFDNNKYLWGNVDKFSVEVKTYNGFKESRYMVASSLFTFDDKKGGRSELEKGWKYGRTFRFIFRGTINDEERQNEFIEENFEESENANVKTLLSQKEILIGKLSIVANFSNKITDSFMAFLASLKNLSENKTKYAEGNYSCDESEMKRRELQSEWSTVEEQIISIENDTLGENPIYTFDVILSRDGILFLKDVTCNKFRSNYFLENTASDFSKTKPLPRLFKVAMNFIKFLFHKNYHHNEDNDTYLPLTNLHSIKEGEELNLNRIIKHQIEAFLSPVIKAKRSKEKYVMLNPKGVLLYAESFLHVFESNKFISNSEASLLYKFIERQSNEFEVLETDNKIILNSFLSQKTILARIAIGLSFMLATIVTFDFIFGKLKPVENYYVLKTCIVAGSFIIGILFHSIAVKRAIANGKFNNKEKPRNFFDKDSNFKKGRLSLFYAIRLSLIEIKMIISELKIYNIQLYTLILFILAIIFSWYFWVF